MAAEGFERVMRVASKLPFDVVEHRYVQVYSPTTGNPAIQISNGEGRKLTAFLQPNGVYMRYNINGKNRTRTVQASTDKEIIDVILNEYERVTEQRE